MSSGNLHFSALDGAAEQPVQTFPNTSVKRAFVKTCMIFVLFRETIWASSNLGRLSSLILNRIRSFIF